MSNEKYWQNRAAWNMYEQMQRAEETVDVISRIYNKASAWLCIEAEGIFKKYMTKHKLSENDARRLLDTLQNRTSLDELLLALKNGDSDKTKSQLLAELEGPAYQSRLERLSQIQNQLDLIMHDVYQQERNISTNFYTELAGDSYYRSIFEIQKRTGLGFSFNYVGKKQIDNVLNMNWSGSHYSNRIWKNTNQLAQTLKEELLVSLITGRTERETADIIANRFSQGAMQARRLVRTEACFVSGEMNAISYKECELKKYRYLATLDLRTSEVCRSLDGKVFLLSERIIGKNYPPMHPWCRSTTISIVSAEELRKLRRRGYNPKTGRTELIPASMTYAEWYKKYIDKESADVKKRK
ncbi:MAG: minor capsid protein [Eubacteriales bacterium]|nr:minor capsid protein [Eubacteriales bacterium]